MGESNGGRQKKDFIFSFEAFRWLSSPRASRGWRRPRHRWQPQSCSEKVRKGSENMNREPFPSHALPLLSLCAAPPWMEAWSHLQQRVPSSG